MSTKLPLHEVAYFSSEHPKFSVKNLLNGSGKWTTPQNSKLDKLEAEFSLGCPTKITGIDIGNFWTSSVEVVVGLSTWPQNKREVLLPSQIFMNRMHCMNGENKETMKFFRSKEHFSEEVSNKKWDRVKVICQQPFRRESEMFGLSMFVLHGEVEKNPPNKPSFVPVTASPLSKNTSNNGLEYFMKNKLDILKPKNGKVSMSGVLKSLENRNSLAENPGTSSPVSRSGKLVVSAQSIKSAKNPKSFRKEALEFLENCGLSVLTFAEIEQVTFRKVKDLWKQKGGREMTRDEKDSLKYISTDYLSKLLNNDSAVSNKRSFEESAAVENPSKRRKMSDERIKMRQEVDIKDKKSSQDGSLRNNIATMDLEKEDDDEDYSRKNHVEKEKKDLYQRKKGKRTPEKYEAGTWIGKAKSPENHKTSTPLPKKVKSKSPTKPSYNPAKLLDFTKEFLLQKGILVQNYIYKKNKELPLKNGMTLSVNKGTPVNFYKVGAEIHMESEGVFHKPDVDPEHLAKLFKDFDEEKIKKSIPSSLIEELFGKPVESEMIDLINDGDSDDEFLKQFDNTLTDVEIKIDDSEDNIKISDEKVDNSQRTDVQKHRQAWLDKLEYKNTKSSQFFFKKHSQSSPIRVQSPPKQKVQSPKPIQSCFGECPMCEMMLPMAELQDHAEACLGKQESPQKSKTSKCPICGKTMKNAILEQHAAECGLGSRGNSPIPPQRESTVPPSLSDKLGTCPMCDVKFWLDELDRHASLCCGRENGGEGFVLNEMDQQDRCRHCNCLVPSVAMEEHVQDCWQNTDTRKRVPTPGERRKSSADIKNRKQYAHLN